MSDEQACKKSAFICSRGTLDGAYPSLVLSVNAARMGQEAYVFCTFMGINLVRKGGAARLRFYPPGFLGALPGMSWLATRMMRRQIDRAGIPAIEELLEMAQLEGVRFIACHMTMQMMGLTRDAFIDGVDVMTAQQYLELAGTCSMNLFT